jgi:hypothetical protein
MLEISDLTYQASSESGFHACQYHQTPLRGRNADRADPEVIVLPPISPAAGKNKEQG